MYKAINVQATTQCKERNTPNYANTRQHLYCSIVSPTGASHKHLHINPNRKKQKERSRDFPLARRPTVPLPCASRATCAPRVSRLSSTCASRATCVPRASSLSCLSCNVRSAGTSSRALGFNSLCTRASAFQARPLPPHSL